MSDLILTEKSNIVAVANAVRNKTGLTNTMTLGQMATHINNIETGGSGGSGGGSVEGFVTVTFMNGNVEVFSRPVYIGDDCPDPVTQGRIETPTKESTAQYDYTHNGWALANGGTANSNALKNIQADTVVYSAYSSTVRKYTITYYDEDGTTVLHTEQVAYGVVPSYEPTHSTDPENYIFDKWEPTATNVTGDTNYVVVWKEKKALNDYTWAELDAMSIEEIRANFKIGEQKDLLDDSILYGQATLIGIEHDDLADGSGKAKMTFALKDFPYVSAGRQRQWGSGGYWGTNTNNPTYYKTVYGNTDLLNAAKIADVNPFVKTVKKDYLENTTKKQSNDTYFALSLAELGYYAFSDGKRYEFFTSKTVNDVLETNVVVKSQSELCWTRTCNGSSGWYYVKYNLKPTSGSRSSKYYITCGFCI